MIKPLATLCALALLALSAVASTASAEETIRINFARDTAPSIDGWHADHGAPFGDRGNGLSYGWNGNNSSTARQRNASNSPSLQHDTLIHMQQSALPQASWEIALPNGRYAVTLLAGDPSFTDSTYRLAVQDVLVIDHKPSSSARWAEATATVLVLDGRLSISSAAGAQNNKLCSVVIEPLLMALTIDFTPSDQSPVAGAYADHGAPFGPRADGLSYGWQGAEPTLIATDGSDPAAAYAASMDGGIWEIAVPNGIYNLSITAAGEAAVPRAHDLLIEGLYQPDTSPAAAGSTLTATVSVSDGRLSIAAAPGAIHPALASLQLSRLEGAVGANDGVPHGLLGSWYRGERFDARKRLAVDPRIQFYWGGQSPWPGIYGDLFTARWQGYLVADETAVHNLRFRFNESMRVWINGEQVLDAWYHHKTWHDEYVDYAFTAGEPVPVVIEYRQRFQSSGLRLLWKPSPGADHPNRESAYTHIPTGNYLPPTDLEAPTIPESVHLTYLSPSRIQISWAPSTDDVAVLGYHIARDGVRVATVLHESIWVDEGVNPGTTPIYTVEAIDWTGALSGPSAPAETWHGLSIAASDIVSHTSPAWIEGASAPATQSIDISVNGGAAAPALRLGPAFWAADAAEDNAPYGIPLHPQTPATVQVTAHGPNGESDSLDLTATWQPLILSPADNPAAFALRAGDTLLLDVDEPAGTPVAYDIGDDGTINYTSTAGSPITITFADPTITTVRAIADLNNDGVFDTYAETVAVLEVTALGVDFDGPIACEVGFRREKGVAVHPLEAADTPVWDSNDASLLEVAVIPDDQLSPEVLDNPNYNPENYGKRLWLKPTRRGTPVLLARTPSGAVIGWQEVDEFTQETSSRRYLIVNAATNSGSATHTIRPYIPGLEVTYDMFSSMSTFAGGLTKQTVLTNQFEVVYDPETQKPRKPSPFVALR